MKVLINGSPRFNNPQVFLRAMGVVMSEVHDDNKLTLLLSGQHKTNDIARQFVNRTEDSFRARGKKLDYVHASPRLVSWDEVDMVVIFVNPPERNTKVGYEAERRGKEVNVFRY